MSLAGSFGRSSDARLAAELNDGTSAYRGGRSRADGRAEVFEVDEETAAVEGDDDDPVEGDDDRFEGDDDHEDDASGERWSDSNGIAYFDNGNGPGLGPGLEPGMGLGAELGASSGLGEEASSSDEDESLRYPEAGDVLFAPERPSARSPGDPLDAARRETPIPGAAPPPAGRASEFRAFTPDLVMVSSASTGSRGDAANPNKTANGVVEGGGDDGRTSSSNQRSPSKPPTLAPARAPSHLTSSEMRDAGNGDEPPGMDPAAVPAAAPDLDLVYDPILDFYYDPKHGKYYQLV